MERGSEGTKERRRDGGKGRGVREKIKKKGEERKEEGRKRRKEGGKENR